jgi:hypothetical protein
MFTNVPGRDGRRNRRVDEDSRPILVSSREDLSLTSPSTENVLFAIDGDDDEHEASALDDTGTRRKSMADRTVRSQDQVQFIAPPLRCMLESREAGTSCMAIFSFFRAARRNRRCQLLRGHVPAIFTEFDIDSDNLDDDAVAHTNLEHAIRHGDPHREQSMPLLIRLLDASVLRSNE